jgi:hypothetical protein
MITFIGTSVSFPFLITINYDSSQSMTAYDLLHSLQDYECLLFCVTDLVLNYESVTSASVVRWWTLHSWTLNFWINDWIIELTERTLLNWISNQIKEKIMLWLTVSWPAFLWIKYPSVAYNQIFITVRQLWVCWRGVLSLTRGRVCSLQFMLTFARAGILGSESRGTRDHILLA